MDSDYGTGITEGRPALAPERVFIGVAALLFAASAAATIYWGSAMSAGMVWMKMPEQTLPGAAAVFVGMWLVMMVAMMLPSFLPRLLSYRGAARRAGITHLSRLTGLAGAGYLAVWAVFGAVAYPIGASLAALEMTSMDLARLAPLATGIVLLLAGVYQLTPWKVRQLAHCRETPSPDVRSAWQYGVSLGVHCSLCCAGYMAVLLAIGVMDLGPMAIIAIAITLERLAPWPVWAARLAGVTMLAVGIFVIIRSSGLL